MNYINSLKYFNHIFIAYYVVCRSLLKNINALFQGLIYREEGKIKNSYWCFDRYYALNPLCVEGVKQIARSWYVDYL